MEISKLTMLATTSGCLIDAVGSYWQSDREISQLISISQIQWNEPDF
jgi:hypothetical protein